MVLSNLTTTSDGKILETGGMIYFNATSNGEQVTINKDVPIHIEIPTLEKKPGMMAYQGVRDENGNMNWINPKPLDNYLSTVDINSLDFLPERFNDVVEKNMPFRKYTTATTSVTDSLYYSLSVSNGRDVFDSMPSNQYNEPYYNKTKKVTKGKYTSKSYSISEAHSVLENQTSPHTSCGVDPAIIKAIKSQKYQNTFIATKEFEARLKVILAEGNSEVLEIYIKNLDKDLYVLDSLAALRCEEQKCYRGLVIIILLFSGKVLSQSAPDTTAGKEDLIYTVVEQPVDFPRGMKGLYKFLHKEIQYPADARKNGISGKVYVQFVIKRDGAIDKENIVILQSLYPSVDEEAVRLVKLMPNWKPALQKGIAVNSKFMLPLTFSR